MGHHDVKAITCCAVWLWLRQPTLSTLIATTWIVILSLFSRMLWDWYSPAQVCIWPFHLGDTASYLNLLSYQVRHAEPLAFITLGSIFQRPFFGGGIWECILDMSDPFDLILWSTWAVGIPLDLFRSGFRSSDCRKCRSIWGNFSRSCIFYFFSRTNMQWRKMY